MIRGYFAAAGRARRPFVHGLFEFPSLGRYFEVPLLVDTGADRTVLSPLDGLRLARELQVTLSSLPRGVVSTGVGGRMNTRTIETVLALDGFSTPLTLTILEPPPDPLPIPSLLGRARVRSPSALCLLQGRYHIRYRANVEVLIHAGAADEYRALPEREQDAMDNAISKLRALGERLGYPHSSAVKGADRLRELRPRAGRSRWRAFYRCIGNVAIIGAFGPEASVHPRGFDAALQRAADRLAAYEIGRG